MSFSTVKVFGEKASPNKVYYNASVVNNYTDTTINVRDPSIVYADSRQNPIILDVSKYDVSVENFTINGASKNLPIFIPQIAPVAIVQVIGYASDGGANTTYYLSNLVPFDVAVVGDYVNLVTGLPDDINANFSTPLQIINIDPLAFSFTVAHTSTAGTQLNGFQGTAKIQNTQNVNYTIYTISLGIFTGTQGLNDGVYTLSTQPVIWEPENKAPFIGIPGRVNPQIDSEYYYCYSYNHWISLVNKALVNAWKDCRRQAIDLDGRTFGTSCPFFTFNPTSGLFTLCQDANTCMVPYGTNLPLPYDVASAEVAYNVGEYSFIGMNGNLEGMLTNWQVIYYSFEAILWDSQPNLYLPEIVVNFGLGDLTNGYVANSSFATTYIQNNTQFLTNPFTNTDLATSYLCLAQEFVSTGTLWSPVASIVIATTKVPIRNEFTTLPVPLGEQNIGTHNQTASAFQKVLIETPLNAVTADIWRGWILYQPLTPTYSSLEDSHVPLKELDFYAYWRNRLTGNLIPLRLYNAGTFTIRLLFDRRD